MAKHDQGGNAEVIAEEPIGANAEVTTDAPATTEEVTSTETPDSGPTKGEVATAAFTDAWWNLLDPSEGDPIYDATTGTIPGGDEGDHVRPIVAAFRAVPNGIRGKVLATLVGQAGERAAAAGNAGMIFAASKLNTALATAPAAVKAAKVERDPSDVLAEKVALVRLAESVLLTDAGVSAESISESVERALAGVPTDALVARLAKVVKATTGSAGGSSTRTGDLSAVGGRGNIDQHVIDAWQAKNADGSYVLPEGDEVTYGAVARVATAQYPNGCSGGSVQNAYGRAGTAGHLVGLSVATTTDKGEPATAVVADRNALTISAKAEEPAAV